MVLLKADLLYAASSCPTCRREYPSSGWVDRMVELGRRVSTTQPAESDTQATTENQEGQNPIEASTTLLDQRGGSTRSSSSATSSTVIRQISPIENESSVNLELVQVCIVFYMLEFIKRVIDLA